MADEQDGSVDIKIPGDEAAPPTSEEKKPAAGAAAAAAAGGEAIPPDEGIDALKAKLAAAERDRNLANTRAEEAERRAAASQNQTQDSNLLMVNNAIELVKQNQETLKANYAAFAAAGEWDKAADVQVQMAEAATQMAELRRGKAALEAAPKAAAPTDPVEQLASGMTPKSAAWIRQHPEYARDPNLTQRMLAAHNFAVTEGLEVESDAYFDRVEAMLGVRLPGERKPAPEEEDDPTAGAAKATGGRQAASPAAAPVSRGGGGGGNGTRATVVRLSKDQREMAANMGMTDEEYAKNLAALQAEGKIVQ